MTSKEWVKNELSYTDDHLTTNDRIMLNKVLQDLELLEEYRNFNNEVVLDTLEKERLIIEENKKLKEENEKLKARCKAIPPLAIRNEKLTKAIEILKGNYPIELKFTKHSDRNDNYNKYCSKNIKKYSLININLKRNLEKDLSERYTQPLM